MLFTEYQEKAATTRLEGAKHPLYAILGLVGEAGEIAEKYKKSLRGDKPLDKESTALELGDVLWYIAALADDLGYSMETIAQMNLDKLASRKNRNKIKGDGDFR